MDQPNILFLLSDQHHSNFTGYAGNKVVRTPNLDQLAAEGTSMENMYCGSPLCVPSRMALMSGLLPDVTRIFTNFHSLPSEQPTFVHSLSAAGYQTVLAGRMHFNGPDQRHGFQERLVGDMTPIRFDQGFAANTGELGETFGQSLVGVTHSGPGHSSVLDFDEDVACAAVDYLSTFDGGNPLFMTVGFYGPHCPFICPGDLFEYYYQRVDAPRIPEGFKESVHPFVQKWYANRGITKVPEDAARRSLAAYCGLVEINDRHVGRVLQALRSNPKLKNTMIVYASDHGEMAGDKGLFWKSSFYEGSVRVPCLFSGPEIPKGKSIQQPTSLLDLAETFREIAGGIPLPQTDGHNLLPLLLGTQEEDPERAVISLLGDSKKDAPGAMIRKGPWKMCVYHGYEHPQLFHLEDDPGEWRDLGRNPDTAEIRAQLMAELAPRWNGPMIEAEVEKIQKISRFWGQWRKTAPPEKTFEISWTADPARNFLEGNP
jgi:choline-sulfatase